MVDETFNRTKLELKHGVNTEAAFFKILLIVPNWN